MESPVEFGKVWAMTKRDMLNWASYRSQILTSLLGATIGIATWALLGTYNPTPVTYYNTTYTSFLVTGILIFSLIAPISRGLDSRLAAWTLETVLMTGMRTSTFVLGTVAWGYVLALVFLVPQVAVAVLLFNVQFSVNITSLVLAIGISSLIGFSLSMITAGFRVVTKVTDPFTWAMSVGQSLFAGMTFPIQHLDSYISGISTFCWILPQTWIYHIFRLSILEDASVLSPGIASAFLGALLFALILLPIGLWVFRWGMARAKREGTLGWF